MIGIPIHDELAGHGYGFTFEIDVFEVGTICNQHCITSRSSIDAGLDGGLGGGNVNEAARGGRQKTKEKRKKKKACLAIGQDKR
jgi:hypothetical protein